MTINATINSWREVTGTNGQGEPVLEDVTLSANVPCELIEPSAARRATERAAGLEVSRIATVTLAALSAASGSHGDPEVGDRFAIAKTRTPTVEEDLEAVDVTELEDEGGQVWQIKFGVRVSE